MAKNKEITIDKKFISEFSHLDVDELNIIQDRLNSGISFIVRINGLYAVIDLEKESIHLRRLQGRIRAEIKSLDKFLEGVANYYGVRYITGNHEGSHGMFTKLGQKLGYYINPEIPQEVIKAV